MQFSLSPMCLFSWDDVTGYWTRNASATKFGWIVVSSVLDLLIELSLLNAT